MHDVQVYVYGWYLAVIHLCRCEKLKWILFLRHLLCTRTQYWEHARAVVLNLGIMTLQGLHIRDLVSQVFTLPFKTVAKLYLWCNNENTLWLGSPHMMNCIKRGQHQEGWEPLFSVLRDIHSHSAMVSEVWFPGTAATSPGNLPRLQSLCRVNE